jgi:hypothetical protein
LLKDLLEAQASLAEVDYQYQQALSAFFSAQSEFDKASGQAASQ